MTTPLCRPSGSGALPGLLLALVVFTLATVTTASAAGPSPAANLDQCRNGAFGAEVPCTGGAWVNGNAGASNAHYVEGDSISYRMRLTGMSTSGSHTLVIEWDITKTSRHALDYLTTWDRTAPTVPTVGGIVPDPCAGIAGAICSAPTTFPIPGDPAIPAALPITGPVTLNQTKFLGTPITVPSFVMYGGSITSAVYVDHTSAVTYAGDLSQSIRITFTASSSTVVLAWGGHIAKRQEWGAPIVTSTVPFTGTAANISGSPYHMRLVSLDGSGGNQDRSVSAAAVVALSSITIVKSASPANDTTFGFTASPAPLSDFSLQDPSNPSQAFTGIIDFATYNVAETIPPAWKIDTGAAGGGIDCSLTPISLDFGKNIFSKTIGADGSSGSVAIALGEADDATCTFYDKQSAGTLTVIKHVVNDNGGSKTASDFTLHVKSGASDVTGSPFSGSEVGTQFTLTPGAYGVSENTPPTGYRSTGFSGDCDSSGSVTIVAGASKTCTITNDDQPAHLIVIKHVINDNNGSAAAADFTMIINGVTASGGNSFAGVESQGTDKTVTPGSYNVTESGPSGYASSFSTDCSGSIALGETKTCTVTNDDLGAHLTVIKHVVNNNGGSAKASDVTISITGNNPSPASFNGAESPGTIVSLNAGSYSVGEAGPSGYAPSLSAGCSGSLSVGETRTCTVTNDDQAAHLIVIKHVVNNNGGSAAAGDFTMTINGITATGGNSFAGAESVGTDKIVTPGTYSVAESGPSGYSASSSSDCSGSIALGETKTCTITNDDQPATLIVIKHVVGGPALASAFTMSVTGNSPSPASFAGAESPGTTVSLNAGAYSVGESGPGGYAASASAGCLSSIAPAETKTCTIINTFLPPNLTITKTPDKLGDPGYEVHPGGTASFTITVSNTGPGPANDVVLTDTLPSGGGVLSWTADNQLCTLSGGVDLNCKIGTLAANTSSSVTVQATIPTTFLLPPSLPSGSSPFEIDGNLAVNTEGNSDWANIGIDCASNPKQGCDLDQPTGNTDNSLGKGTKEDTAVPSVVSGSIPNNKSDLTRFYLASQKVSGTDFLYLAWERVQAPTGTTNMDFELNQSPTMSGNGVTPVRTAGDLLITYDLDSGGTVPTLGYHVWATAASANGQSAANVCAASAAFPCWDKVHTLNANVVGAVNTLTVSDPILAAGQASARSLDPTTFGEALINLQAAGIFPPSLIDPSQCIAFGQAYLKSRSSSAFTSEIKDFIAPLSVTVSNCPPKLLDNQAFTAAFGFGLISDTGQIKVDLAPPAALSSSLRTAPSIDSGSPDSRVELLAGAATGASLTSAPLDLGGPAQMAESLGWPEAATASLPPRFRAWTFDPTRSRSGYRKLSLNQRI